MSGESDFGWGDTETEAAQPFGGVGSAVLVVASGVYCAAIWLASGLLPLQYLASRVRERRDDGDHGAQPIK
jgi:hypothetical protein